MRIRFYFDPESGEPHIQRHDVTELEIEQVLSRPLESRPGRDGARVVLGKTREGRFLRVIWVPEPSQWKYSCRDRLRARP